MNRLDCKFDIFPCAQNLIRLRAWYRDEQGMAIKIAMGGLYFCPDVVERLLYPMEGNNQRVLDIGQLSSWIYSSVIGLNSVLGCGTGMWYVTSLHTEL
jgi:hypothetical protein